MCRGYTVSVCMVDTRGNLLPLMLFRVKQTFTGTVSQHEPLDFLHVTRRYSVFLCCPSCASFQMVSFLILSRDASKREHSASQNQETALIGTGIPRKKSVTHVAAIGQACRDGIIFIRRRLIILKGPHPRTRKASDREKLCVRMHNVTRHHDTMLSRDT